MTREKSGGVDTVALSMKTWIALASLVLTLVLAIAAGTWRIASVTIGAWNAHNEAIATLIEKAKTAEDFQRTTPHILEKIQDSQNDISTRLSSIESIVKSK